MATLEMLFGFWDSLNQLWTSTNAIALEVGDRAGEGAAYVQLGSAFRSLGQFDKPTSSAIVGLFW